MSVNSLYRNEAIATRTRLVDSPAFQAQKDAATVWSAVVLWDNYTENVSDEWLKSECKRIRETGFQAVRFHHIMPVYKGKGVWDTTTADRWISAAEEAGLDVIAVGEVFRNPPALLLEEHGLDLETFQKAWFTTEESLAVLKEHVAGTIGKLRGRVAVWCVLGEPNSEKFDATHPQEVEQFQTWLEQKYSTIEGLSDAWRSFPTQPNIPDWKTAIALACPNVSGGMTGVGNSQKMYGAVRDLQAFTAERTCILAEHITAAVSEADPGVPVGVGSHQLFINQASLGWDIGRWARAGSLHTTSIHLSWHFESVGGEVDVPVYLQARGTRDMNKSGFTSAFETTGGAVQFSGGYGNHMDCGLMRRLCLSYLAAGNQTMAFWTWNCRPGGWEQGEYGMLGQSGAIMPWAHEAGRIAKAMQTWRDEIWAEDHIARVGIVESWNTDAILTLEPHRHGSNDGIPGEYHGGTKGLHRQALIGAARAMTNAGMDWEYVTSSELIDGLSGCYDTLVLPMHRALDEDLLSVLDEYVKHGGRIVVDCQFDFCDAHGRVSLHGEDTVAGKLFGAWTETVHDGRTGGPIWEGQPVEGFWADLEINDAEVVARFSDGRAAVTRKAHGEGEAILMALDPASAALTPENAWAETLLTSLAQTTPNAWSSTLPLTLCRTTPDADHFFLINPGPATTAYLHQDGVNEWLDVLEGTPLKGIQGGCAVPIEAGSACWVRANTSR